VRVTHDRAEALDGARVVYAKSWGPRGHYGDADAGAAAVRAHPEWIVDAAAVAATDGGLFMHCLPVRRGVVVSDEVLDSPASVVLDQAAARLDVQKASLCWAMGVTP
jgi:N-acetylornithine carbamoyltransferase